MTNAERQLLIWYSVMLAEIESARAERERCAEKMVRRDKIIDHVVYFLEWLITTLLVFGIAASIYTTLFSSNWWSQFLGTLGSYLVSIFLYWTWGKVHLKSRDKTTMFLKAIWRTLYGITRNIIGHWR